MKLYDQAIEIIQRVIQDALPDQALREALGAVDLGRGRTILIAVGKGAWQMAKVARETLGNKIDSGVLITKYGHVQGKIPGIICIEAGHPYPDENSYQGTQAALDATKGLTKEDTVLFLLSGGGSSLLEMPLIPPEEMAGITKQLLACGADIVEINTVRKRLSGVKGGRFALHCAPARVVSIQLSDVLGGRLDMIASGPVSPDASTCEDAQRITQKYGLQLSSKALSLLGQETPKALHNVEIHVIGSVSTLCYSALEKCSELGYDSTILTDHLDCEAREAGTFLGNICQYWSGKPGKYAFIAGGETVVHLTGNGKGGRNQELALSAAVAMAKIPNVALFSIGSDGTDGVTDAAGGYVDGQTVPCLKQLGIDVHQVISNNDSYYALEKTGGLIITGATGTNINDVAVLLISNSTPGDCDWQSRPYEGPVAN